MRRFIPTILSAGAGLAALTIFISGSVVDAEQPQVLLTEANIHHFSELDRGFACYTTPGAKARLGKVESKVEVGSQWRDLHLERVLHYFDHISEKLAQHDTGVQRLSTTEAQDTRIVHAQLEKRIDSLLALFETCTTSSDGGIV